MYVHRRTMGHDKHAKRLDHGSENGHAMPKEKPLLFSFKPDAAEAAR